MYKLIVVILVTMMFLIPSSVKAQEITDPNLPIVRCASLMCTDPLYFFEYRMYMPMIGGNQ